MAITFDLLILFLSKTEGSGPKPFLFVSLYVDALGCRILPEYWKGDVKR
jgi:hypothetical protein